MRALCHWPVASVGQLGREVEPGPLVLTRMLFCELLGGVPKGRLVSVRRRGQLTQGLRVKLAETGSALRLTQPQELSLTRQSFRPALLYLFLFFSHQPPYLDGLRMLNWESSHLTAVIQRQAVF